MSATRWTRRDFLTRGLPALGAATAAAPGLLLGTAAGPGLLPEAEGAPANGSSDGRTPPPTSLNIVVIITDDQDLGSLSVMRKLLSYPAGGWTNFAAAISNAPICAPSRATLLTGQYPHRHGVTTNNEKEELDTATYLPARLQQAGYKVGHVGKWLKGNRRIPTPPGFALFSQGGRAGTVFPKGCDFIRAAAGQPFVLFLCPVDPHRHARPASEYARVELELPPLPPVETDLSDKPEWVRRRPSHRADERERLNAYRAVLGVDDGVQAVVDTLAQVGVLDNTAIVYVSDNGYSWGSNGIAGKNAPYEPSIRVPMLIRLPGLPDREESRVVSVADLAVTIADLTGATLDAPDGRSLVPLLHDPAAPWESEAFIEGYPDRRRPNGSWWGVRTDNFTYVENSTGELELYDLAADPFQHQNVAGWPAYAEAQAALANRLAAMRGAAGLAMPKRVQP